MLFRSVSKPLSKTILTDGNPLLSAVARDMALGSLISFFFAFSYHSVKSSSGSVVRGSNISASPCLPNMLSGLRTLHRPGSPDIGEVTANKIRMKN